MKETIIKILDELSSMYPDEKEDFAAKFEEYFAPIMNALIKENKIPYRLINGKTYDEGVIDMLTLYEFFRTSDIHVLREVYPEFTDDDVISIHTLTKAGVDLTQAIARAKGYLADIKKVHLGDIFFHKTYDKEGIVISKVHSTNTLLFDSGTISYFDDKDVGNTVEFLRHDSKAIDAFQTILMDTLH